VHTVHQVFGNAMCAASEDNLAALKDMLGTKKDGEVAARHAILAGL